MGFSLSQLAALRKAATSFFDDTCTIELPSTTPNSMGGRIAGFTVSATDVKCLIRPEKRIPTENTQGGAMTSTQRFEVLLAVGTAITVQARIISGRGPTYEVQGHDADRENPVTIICRCIRIDDGTY